MYTFNYHKPSTLAEALALFNEAEDPKYLAGGHTLLPAMKQRLAAPTDLIDLQHIEELQGISAAGDELTIGAFTTHAAVAESELVKSKIPALAVLAGLIGDAQVRNRGTMGGSVVNSDPAADYPAAVLALGAVVITDRREIGADKFFLDMFETSLEESELVTGFRFPIPEKSAYVKHPNPASRYATVGVFIAQSGDACSVAVTGAGPCAFRSAELEKAVTLGDPAAVDACTFDPEELNSDLHASGEYRAHLIKVITRRAMTQLA